MMAVQPETCAAVDIPGPPRHCGHSGDRPGVGALVPCAKALGGAACRFAEIGVPAASPRSTDINSSALGALASAGAAANAAIRQAIAVFSVPRALAVIGCPDRRPA